MIANNFVKKRNWSNWFLIFSLKFLMALLKYLDKQRLIQQTCFYDYFCRFPGYMSLTNPIISIPIPNPVQIIHTFYP